jgi:hypothetical protein
VRVASCEFALFNIAMASFDSPGADAWSAYVAARDQWLAQRRLQPGAFASPAETYYNLSCCVPLPLDAIPILVLPLRVHLARGPEFGCTLTEDDLNFQIVPLMNEYWAQARIEWTLESVESASWPEDMELVDAEGTEGVRRSLGEVRSGIWNLKRDPETGKMAGKGLRRDLFLGCLLKGFRERADMYDVHVFDFIGEESQGEWVGEGVGGWVGEGVGG